MKQLFYILQKEFNQTFKDKSNFVILFIAPIFQLLILPWAADYEIKNITIAIVDNNHTISSKKLISKITASKYFIINSFNNNYDEALDEIEKNKADIIIDIPHFFEQCLNKYHSSNIFIGIDAVDNVKANVANAYLQIILQQFNKQLITKIRKHHFISNSIDITSKIRYNPLMNYQLFMVPGILVLLMTSGGIFLCAMGVVREKEQGTIEQINVTPIKTTTYILGKLIPIAIVELVVFTVGLLIIGRLVYQIVPLGNIALLYIFLTLYLITSLSIGLIISVYVKTQQQATLITFFFLIILELMCGLFTPVESMVFWAQWIAKINPLTYFVEVMRMIVLKGSSFFDLYQHFLIMICYAVGFSSIAIWSYKKGK